MSDREAMIEKAQEVATDFIATKLPQGDIGTQVYLARELGNAISSFALEQTASVAAEAVREKWVLLASGSVPEAPDRQIIFTLEYAPNDPICETRWVDEWLRDRLRTGKDLSGNPIEDGPHYIAWCEHPQPYQQEEK